MLNANNQYDRLIYDEWFGLFPYHIRAQLNSKAEVRQFKAGESIFVLGQVDSWMGAILSGRIRICLHSNTDKEMLISMVERGEMFGERTVFDGMPRSGDAIAQEDTTCLLFYRDDIVPAMYSCPETMMYVIRILCNRAVRYLNTMELFAMQNVPIRLANFLLFLGDKYGREENGKIPLKINLSQTELSQQIATSRESINRQIKGFIEKGLITMENGEITLTDVPGLKKLCQVAVSD